MGAETRCTDVIIFICIFGATEARLPKGRRILEMCTNDYEGAVSNFWKSESRVEKFRKNLGRGDRYQKY